MREIILVAFGLVYLLMSACFFTLWLEFLKRDSHLSLQEKRFSWVVLVIATVFWLAVVPIAYLELLLAKRNNWILFEQPDDSERDFNL